MFSAEFRERLRYGKYSRWAVDLTEPELEAVIWMIGEYGYRAFHVLPLLKGLWKQEGTGRAVHALECLYRVVGDDRPDREEYSCRVRRFLAEVRGHAEETGDPPAHSWPVRWQGLTVGWIVSPELDEYGNCSGAWWPHATDAKAFLDQMREWPPDGIQVTVGGIPASVRPPESNKVMAFWTHVSPQNYELHQRTMNPKGDGP